jgi:hypothetical protein
LLFAEFGVPLLLLCVLALQSLLWVLWQLLKRCAAARRVDDGYRSLREDVHHDAHVDDDDGSVQSEHVVRSASEHTVAIPADAAFVSDSSASSSTTGVRLLMTQHQQPLSDAALPLSVRAPVSDGALPTLRRADADARAPPIVATSSQERSIVNDINDEANETSDSDVLDATALTYDERVRDCMRMCSACDDIVVRLVVRRP